MLHIDFSCVETFGVILQCPSGVLYSNQAGGISCTHPEAEGAFVPYGVSDEQGLCDLSCKHGCFGAHFDQTAADELDSYFQSQNAPFKIDRAHLDEGTEAWLPVIVTDIDDRFNPLTEFVGRAAIYVHPNCD